MLLGDRTYSDNQMNAGETESGGGAMGNSELRASKAVKSNGSALKNATMSAEKKVSPSKGGSDGTGHQQARQRDKLLINNGGTVLGGSHSIPMTVGSTNGPGSATQTSSKGGND